MLTPSSYHQGEVENRLLALSGSQQETQSPSQTPNPSNFSTFVVRPGYVLAKQPGVLNSVMGLSKAWTIRVDDLAAAMVEIALEGEGEQIVENEGLRARALPGVKK